MAPSIAGRLQTYINSPGSLSLNPTSGERLWLKCWVLRQDPRNCGRIHVADPLYASRGHCFPELNFNSVTIVWWTTHESLSCCIGVGFDPVLDIVGG